MESAVKKHEFKPLSTRRISQIDGDILALVAVFGPHDREENYIHTVRGVVVQTTHHTKTEAGKRYRLCIFPGWNYQWVNEGNLRSRRIARTAGELERVRKQA